MTILSLGKQVRNTGTYSSPIYQYIDNKKKEFDQKKYKSKMSQTNCNMNNQQENRGSIQLTIRSYCKNSIKEINHQGYVDINKTIDNVRILVLNTRGCNPWNDYKGEMLIKACQELQVDIALLNKTNVKWTPGNLDKMKQRFSSIEREVLVEGADSG